MWRIRKSVHRLEVVCNRCGGDHPYVGATSPDKGSEDPRDDVLEEVLSGSSNEGTLDAVDQSNGSAEYPSATGPGESSLVH